VVRRCTEPNPRLHAEGPWIAVDRTDRAKGVVEAGRAGGSGKSSVRPWCFDFYGEVGQ